MTKPPFGQITWVDLTVANAPEIRDFYTEVVSWAPSPIPMEGYEDFAMGVPGSDDAVAGVCHARGENAGIPPAWLIYITVPDLAAASARATALGATAITALRDLGAEGGFQILRDPAGAAFGLFQPATSDE